MRTYTVYVCETCGLELRDAMKMREHEASHLGLTLDEMLTYQSLKNRVKSAGMASYLANNDSTQQELDDAANELVAFEKAHNLI